MSFKDTIKKRRTFAIIAHPDAGKTTLTEKLLLFGGAIQMAGMVKAKGDRRRARSDWMKVEQERGISVASSVMTFDYNDITFNLLDTPGSNNFVGDTVGCIRVVDGAVVVVVPGDVVVVELTSSDGAALAVCSFRDDTGAGTVPVGTFDVPGSGRLSLHRVRTSEFSAGDVDLGELRFDFEVAANVSFTP